MIYPMHLTTRKGLVTEKVSEANGRYEGLIDRSAKSFHRERPYQRGRTYCR